MSAFNPAAIIVFKDEADIITKTILHWRKLGIRRFYFCDNGSTDHSGFLVQKMMQPEDVYIYDDRTTWIAPEMFNKLKNMAIDNGHDWIFPIDADEQIELLDGYDLQKFCTELQAPEYAAYEIHYLNILPDGRKYWQTPHRKVFGKLKREWVIQMGNHYIKNVEPTEVMIYAHYNHYSIRSKGQFMQKMKNWMTVMKNSNLVHPHTDHWHNWQREGDSYIENLYNQLTL